MNFSVIIKIVSLAILAAAFGQNAMAMENPANNDLLRASYSGDLGGVKNALDRGADINYESMLGMPLHCACYTGHKEIVEFLLTHWANINYTNKSGDTALHWASFAGNQEIVKLLLDCGADINCANGYGETPLDWVNKLNNTLIINLISDEYEKRKMQQEYQALLLQRLSARPNDLIITRLTALNRK
jgi:ankyrin repeat protein